jgi:ABC-type phosphate/phosphonate transport system substrate-binding protein
MASYLSTKLGRKVQYVPVTDYAASVSLFRTGDLDMVFFGGLTGVQAGSRHLARPFPPSATSTTRSRASSSPAPPPGSGP